MDADYELKITPTRKKNIQPFILFAHPMWMQTEGSQTEIGFHVLHSPGSRQLATYVRQLAASEDTGDIPVEAKYQYV
jgi:hypothetical protein